MLATQPLPAPPTRPGADSLVPALAVTGILGAVLVADAFQLGAFSRDGSARGLLMLFVPLLSVGFGLVLRGGSRGRWPRLSWAARALVGGAVATGVMATVLQTFVWGSAGDVVAESAVGVAALAPVLALLSHLHARALRARPGSLLRACDDRALWSAVAAIALVGSSVATTMPAQAPGVGRGAAQAIGFLALLLMPWFAGRNVTALVRAWYLARRTTTLHRATEVSRELDVLDLGVGDDVFEERAGGSAYRTAPATRVVVGSPAAALRLVRVDTVVLVLATVGATALFGVTRGLS